jgi:alkylation response protein AidB-like acyl-CoA dehydrogenase
MVLFSAVSTSFGPRRRPGTYGRGEVARRREDYFTPNSLERWLQPVASGEKIIAFALSEPCCGSDAFSLETKAERRGGSWVINGTKLWITSGIYADAFLVAAA